jgi:hypothetical protein
MHGRVRPRWLEGPRSQRSRRTQLSRHARSPISRSQEAIARTRRSVRGYLDALDEALLPLEGDEALPISISPNGVRNTRPQPGRDPPEWVVAINRNGWSQSAGAPTPIADGDFAFFTTRCPAATSIETLVAVEGHRWAIEDSFETAKNESDSITMRADPGMAGIATFPWSCSPSP